VKKIVQNFSTHSEGAVLMQQYGENTGSITKSCVDDEQFSNLLNGFTICFLIFAMLAAFPLVANGSEIGELNAKIRQMQVRHQQEIRAIRKNVLLLSQNKRKTKTSSRNELSGLVNRLEQKLEQSMQTGFTSPKKWHFDLGGELEYEFVKTENGAGVAKRNARFQIDQLYLYPKVRYRDMALFSADIAIKTSTALIEEAWAQFYGISYNTYVEIGLNDLFIANISRKTEAEILIESAFYRDDDMGIRLGGKPSDWLYWQVGVTNGFQLGTRSASEDPSFVFIADRKNASNSADRPYFAIDIGFKPNLGKNGKIDILPFYYNGLLSDADVSFLHAVTGYSATSMADEKHRYGLNVRYDFSDLTIIGQFLEAKDGDLDRTGWFIQPSYLIYKDSNRRWFKAYEVLYRYSDLDVDLPNVFADTLTWDRYQHVFALLLTVFDSTTLKIEYHLNGESTGASDVDNDEFLMQLEIKW
jgi:hypothetical protein